MITNLLLATILSTSFSVRTPNDDTKPLDYEYMAKAEKNEGNFTYNAKRDWERELGNKYIDDVAKFNQNIGIVYGGVDYIFDLSVKTDFTDNNIWNIKSEVKKWFGKFNIFGLYKHEYYNNKEDFQFKVGIGVKL